MYQTWQPKTKKSVSLAEYLKVRKDSPQSTFFRSRKSPRKLHFVWPLTSFLLQVDSWRSSPLTYLVIDGCNYERHCNQLTCEGPCSITSLKPFSFLKAELFILCLQPFSVTLSPFSPLAPGKPGKPLFPFGPSFPCFPCGPCGPVFPGSPLSPLCPFSPGGPCGPWGPGIIVRLTIWRKRNIIWQKGSNFSPL